MIPAWLFQFIAWWLEQFGVKGYEQTNLAFTIIAAGSLLALLLAAMRIAVWLALGAIALIADRRQ